MPKPADAPAALLAALAEITGTGNFYSEGSATFFLPEIEIEVEGGGSPSPCPKRRRKP